MLALYAGFATLQALDAHSTVEATRSGYRESNPVVAPFAQTPAAMYAFKAATTTVTILLVEKLRKRHRGAAIGLMIAANVAYASVVALQLPPVKPLAPRHRLDRRPGPPARTRVAKLMSVGPDDAPDRIASRCACAAVESRRRGPMEEQLRVFVIDDDPLVLRAIERVLQSNGYRC